MFRICKADMEKLNCGYVYNQCSLRNQNEKNYLIYSCSKIKYLAVYLINIYIIYTKIIRKVKIYIERHTISMHWNTQQTKNVIYLQILP